MTSAATKLKELRKAASPPLTVRAMAEELGLPFGTYSAYEAASRYKKTTLPLDFARRVAAVLAERGVDPAEVMKIAGLTAGETEPEVRAIEAARPEYQYVPLRLLFPSEAALRDMFRSLLELIPTDATKDEAAEILARRLPTGFESIGPAVLSHGSAAAPTNDAVPPTPARDRPASGQALHT